MVWLSAWDSRRGCSSSGTDMVYVAGCSASSTGYVKRTRPVDIDNLREDVLMTSTRCQSVSRFYVAGVSVWNGGMWFRQRAMDAILSGS